MPFVSSHSFAGGGGSEVLESIPPPPAGPQGGRSMGLRGGTRGRVPHTIWPDAATLQKRDVGVWTAFAQTHTMGVGWRLSGRQ